MNYTRFHPIFTGVDAQISRCIFISGGLNLINSLTINKNAISWKLPMSKEVFGDEKLKSYVCVAQLV